MPSRPHLEDVDLFDAAFFGIKPRDAALIDPQQRIFLEIAWEALEDAGYDPARYEGAIGVFAGAAFNTYLLNNVLAGRDQVEDFTSNYQVGCYPTFLGGISDSLATRVAHKLDLRGPAITMLSACSTSLLCVAEACQSLQSGQSDMALAGGVSVTVPQKRGYIHQPGGMVSGDGVCRPFDASASGTVFGSGAGCVLLKRLDDALADGDHIHAVIRGCGVNNDGAAKVSYTGPSAEGQAAVIKAAHRNAGVDPATIGYVECHGTATPLGDPIEFLGLSAAFADAGLDQRCVLGSTKGNVGHLDVAAGITGLIKTALMLREREIPPLAQFRSINPAIDLNRSPFKVATSLTPWPEGSTPRRAGVSSFGIGGTNVHVVMEEPSRSVRLIEEAADRIHILPLSARSDAALNTTCAALAQSIVNCDVAMEDVAFTLQHGRHAFSHRAAFVCESAAEAVSRLASPPAIKGLAPAEAPGLVFLFPGQGSQYPGMASGLYHSEAVFAEWIDKGADILEPMLGFDIRTLICRDVEGADAARALRDTQVTQPALFLTEYATAQLWIDRGIVPAGMVGHSVGELAAACIAGVLSFEDALRLIAHRGRLMQNCEAGAMLSVRATESELRDLLIDGADLAALNAPKLSVVAGPFEAIEAFEAVLAKAGLQASRLHTSHAFHSAMMDPVVEALRAKADEMRFAEPQLPFVSSVTGEWAGREVMAGDYWADHCRQKVRFADALRTACDGTKPVLLEVGPGRTLSTFAAQTLKRGDLAANITSLPDHERGVSDQRAIAEATARLWTAGVSIDWPQQGSARRTSLPTYPFERERFWIDAPTPLARQGLTTFSPRAQASLELNNGPDHTETNTMNAMPEFTVERRTARFEITLTGLLSDLSGQPGDELPTSATFVELGFDSLFLGLFSQEVQKRFGVKVSFRQLLGDIGSVASLAAHLNRELPAATVAPAPTPVPAPAPMPATSVIVPVVPAAPIATSPMIETAEPGRLESIMHGQLQTMQAIFAEQMHALTRLQGAAHSISVACPVAQPTPAPQPVPAPEDIFLPAEEGPSRFRMYRPGSDAAQTDMPDQTRAFIADLVNRFGQTHPTSKAMTQDARAHLADPRTAAGFRATWKDAVFPIVAASAKGSRITDMDGNTYVDLVNGYGQCAFGHAPDFVLRALAEQMEKGFAIGPQSPLAGKVAERIGRMIGHERVTFCNTGSEAVMAAMRVARSVTGRDRVVVFSNDYHGQFDEVLVKRGGRAGAAMPIAPGIPAGSVGNMSVIPYGAPESLDWIARHAGEIAAVVIEPIQSRHPELRPVEFVRELRALTAQKDIALVFDEVVSGFRVAPGGVQSLWGIQGDMATYGKVLGGSMPLGILAGSARYMDALDGGFWRYGDASEPEVSPTFFAGTFVRHPLTLAAADAVLTHIEGEGRALYDRVAPRTAALVEEINADLASRGVPARAEVFSSWFVINFSQTDPLGSLAYTQLRQMGLHIQEGFPCYLTTAHSEDDFAFIIRTFRDATDALQAGGILCPPEGMRPMAVTKQPEPPAIPVSAPLTESQMEIWLAAQMGPAASAAFNESFSITIDGSVDDAALQAALRDVAMRHDALRTVFAKDGKSQSVQAESEFDVARVDLSQAPDVDAAIKEIIAADARKPFDLTQAPPVRAALLRLPEGRSLFLFTAHHIVCDGWSGNIIAEDLATAYSARMAERELDMPEAASFFRHTAAAKPASEGEAAFWLDRFQTVPDPLDLPFDRARPEQRSYQGATVTRELSADMLKRVRKAGAAYGCTLFSTLLGSLHILLARLSGQEDFAIAVPSAGQSLDGNEGLVGHCVNLLPIRLASTPSTALRDHFKAVQTHVSDAFEHRSYTYGTLVRRLAIKPMPGVLPLTQVQFNLERVPEALSFGGRRAMVTPNPKAFSNFDLFFNVIEQPDGLRLDVDYNTDVLDDGTIARWIDCFGTLLDALAGSEAETVGALPVVPADQARWLIDDLNRTQALFDDQTTVVDMFAEQVTLRPNSIAVRYRDQALTYAELDQRSTQLARHIASLDLGTGQRVAIAVERSAEMLVSLLAVMKAGHTYIPLDPAHPAPRLTQTMEMAAVAAVIADSDDVGALRPQESKLIHVHRDMAAISAQDKEPLPRSARDGSASAYIIFTSGSTGIPKGVEVPHRALTNFLRSMAKEPGFGPQDSIVALTTISFDIAALELYLPLICGGTVVIADRSEVTDGFALVDRIKASGARVLQATPTLWRMLLEAGFEPDASMRMLCGGEALPRYLAERLTQSGGTLWNMYGPTETTIWSSVDRVDASRPITIGHPIDNTSLHILSPEGQLQPVGAIGELHIGGVGLAHGYLNQPDLTEKSFRSIALPGHTIQRLYSTGDVGKRLPDGSLQLLGRRDNQVKLRGFRIELGDIEAVLRKVKGIADAAVDVKAKATGDRQLVGYYVCTPGQSVSAETLATQAAAKLPAYMLPSAWVQLEALPETANGKLDRKALPLPGLAVSAAPTALQGPTTQLEHELAEIWKNVLGIPEVDVRHNIFSLGADSLSVFRIAARMMEAGLGLDARDLLKFPTIRDLARHAAQAKPGVGSGSATSLKDFRNGARRAARRVA
ncbi:hypothetical protein GCM10016234_35680 [Tianweitania populi]|uniref:Amino acid adenylation domain-containing protein n=1 Tax=Tianweitania populi TaxID=1607949 RepID=A0A8J3GM45_9HYPH|nr:hypothetical protein GCM10016234_35680 [Tianweitania populi]